MKAGGKAKVGRRDFLRTLGVGAGAAVASAGALSTAAQADSESAQERRKARYQETEHVKTYYRVNRYPARG